MSMHHTDGDPVELEIELLVTDEERRALEDPDVPDDVKSEIKTRLERFDDYDLDRAKAEDSGAKI